MRAVFVARLFSVRGHNLSDFTALNLAAPLLAAVEEQGFVAPTPIQSLSIPPLLEGHDLMGIAHTGGGKTAAFSLPLLHKLLQTPGKPKGRRAKALILAPTRELAQQIGKCVADFSRGTKLTNCVIAGGLPYGPQITKLRRGVDVLIATPGRLMDHLSEGHIGFDDTETFILDEADRMLDMGFIHDVRRISEALPRDHQTIMFSATMSPKIKKLSEALLNAPVHVAVKQKNTVAETIDHKMMSVAKSDKKALLYSLLDQLEADKILVFARTKRGADRLAKQISNRDISADSIHGDKRQRQREKILKGFRNGRISVLVATDLAARGIDVDGVTHVINFDLPMEAENYVHRVGRTGRAGQSGTAISFCDVDEVLLLRAIERLIKISIEVDETHAFHVDVVEPQKSSQPKKRQKKRRGGGRSKGGGNKAASAGGRSEKSLDQKKQSKGRPAKFGAKPRRRSARKSAGQKSAA